MMPTSVPFSRGVALVSVAVSMVLTACGGEAPERDEAVGADGASGATEEALRAGGGPGAGTSSCGVPPLQCGGKNRAIYPGCSVDCPRGQTALCMPGDCFWRSAPICTCMNPPYAAQ